MSAPLFGLRWVPDSQLRPLRYAPSPSIPTYSSRTSTERETPYDGAAASGSAPVEASGSAERAPVRLQEHVLSLTQRLQSAEESVRQKSEQIRWLKEMGKDEARRARVSKWMAGPLVRTFSAWKRLVRNVARAALAELESNMAVATEKQRELQARCDELTRKQGVLQTALERFLVEESRRRQRKALRAAMRRWAVRRTLTLRSARAKMRRCLMQLRVCSSRRSALQTQSLLACDQRRRRRVRRALRALRLACEYAKKLGVAARAHAPLTLRSAMRWLRARCWRVRASAAAAALVLRLARRAGVRRAWGRWAAVAIAELGSSAKREVAERRRIEGEAARQANALQASELEARRLRVATSLWGKDELPQMLQALEQAASRAASSSSAAAEQPTWNGQQIHLVLSSLDSLKRELARERAAVGIAREEAKQNDSRAEKALALLQQVTSDEATNRQKLEKLEAENTRTKQLLQQQERQLFSSRRAHEGISHTVGRHLAQLEETFTRQMRGLEARCDQQSHKVLSLQRRVSRATSSSRSRSMDALEKSLLPRRPAPTGSG